MKIQDRWKIKTTKDWVLASLFTALIVYVVVTHFFQWKIESFMQKFMPDKMSTINQPGGYGTVLFCALGMAVIAMAVLALNRRKIRYIAAAGLTGFLIADCALAGFVFHCRLIVQRGSEEPAESAWIAFEDRDENMNLAEGDERLEHLQELAFSLKEQPAEFQVIFREQVKEEGRDHSFIWFSFPKKYFYGYDAVFHIESGLIFMDRGADGMVFYEDNGFLECMEELKNGVAEKN